MHILLCDRAKTLLMYVSYMKNDHDINTHHIYLKFQKKNIGLRKKSKKICYIFTDTLFFIKKILAKKIFP